jgi:hypothetical protein
VTTATAPTTTEFLTAAAILEQHHTAMVDHLTGTEGFQPDEAEAAITYLPGRITSRLMKEWGFTPADAARSFARAVCWLASTADGTTAHAPDDDEDAGWHMLLIYDPEYRALSQALAGHVISHIVNDIPGYPRGDGYCNTSHCDKFGGGFHHAD